MLIHSEQNLDVENPKVKNKVSFAHQRNFFKKKILTEKDLTFFSKIK